jgi:hypothetical protein
MSLLFGSTKHCFMSFVTEHSRNVLLVPMINGFLRGLAENKTSYHSSNDCAHNGKESSSNGSASRCTCREKKIIGL